MEFQAFDTVDEMFNAMREGEEAANARLLPGHIELRDDTEHTRYWCRVVPEYDNLTIFGIAWTADEADESERNAGASPEEALASRERLANSRQRGYLYGPCYSAIEPDGELGSTHVFNVVPICKASFESAKALGWKLIAQNEAPSHSPDDVLRSVTLARALVAHAAALGCAGGES